MDVGQKVQDGSGAEVIVIRAPAAEVAFRPGGLLALGKRHRCGVCSAEVLVSRPGPVEIACCGSPMALATAKALPSSD